MTLPEILDQLQSKETMVDASGTPLSDSDLKTVCTALKSSASFVTGLDLHESNLSDASSSTLCDTFQAMTNLHDLSLCWNALTFQSLPQLLQSFPPSLKELYLTGNVNLGDQGVIVLSQSALMNQLIVLDLGECGVTVKGVSALCQTLPRSTIKELSLAYNKQLGDEGLQALCMILPSTTQLVQLDVSRCGVTDLGATSLAIVMNSCPSLEELRLANNDISDVGGLALLQAVKQSSTLSVCDLENNELLSHDMETDICNFLKQPQRMTSRD